MKFALFLFKKIHLKMLSAKWQPFWVCLNVLRLSIAKETLKNRICCKHYPILVLSGARALTGTVVTYNVSYTCTESAFKVEARSVIDRKVLFIWINIFLFCFMFFFPLSNQKGIWQDLEFHWGDFILICFILYNHLFMLLIVWNTVNLFSSFIDKAYYK